MNKDFLPQGDRIRQLLVKSNITDAGLNLMLKEKGVFLGRSEKNNSVPVLMKSLISPDDFESLYAIQKHKEEKIKHRTSTIKCKQEFDLADIFKSPIDINKEIENRHTYQPSYKVIGSPSFYFDDNNVAKLDYRVVRENLLNDWTDNKTIHEGSIILKKSTEGDIQITVQQNSTSKETLEVNQIMSTYVKEVLEQKTIIDKKDAFVSIRFNDFTNENRIKFLYAFCKDFCIYAKFKSLTDLNLNLDPNVKSEEDIEKFLAEIDNLKLKGKELQNHVFLTSNTYHPKLLFGAVKLRFEIKYKGIDGTLILSASFPDYVRRKNEFGEFQFQLEFVLPNVKRRFTAESDLRNKLLPFLEDLKMISYKKLKNNSS
jgi:hypothetical protein